LLAADVLDPFLLAFAESALSLKLPVDLPADLFTKPEGTKQDEDGLRLMATLLKPLLLVG